MVFFTYIWLIFMVNVGIDTIHGSYGYDDTACFIGIRISWFMNYEKKTV